MYGVSWDAGDGARWMVGGGFECGFFTATYLVRNGRWNQGRLTWRVSKERGGIG